MFSIDSTCDLSLGYTFFLHLTLFVYLCMYVCIYLFIICLMCSHVPINVYFFVSVIK